MTKAEARKFCRQKIRPRTLSENLFHADINDPLLYHLVINTSLIDYENAAQLIGDAMLNLR